VFSIRSQGVEAFVFILYNLSPFQLCIVFLFFYRLAIPNVSYFFFCRLAISLNIDMRNRTLFVSVRERERERRRERVYCCVYYGWMTVIFAYHLYSLHLFYFCDSSFPFFSLSKYQILHTVNIRTYIIQHSW